MNDYKQVKLMPDSIAIFDLDGCVFDDEWRMNLIKPVGHPDRFGEYHRALTKDATIEHGAKRLNHHLRCGDGIAFITARPEAVRQQTVDVIRACFNMAFPTEQVKLFMRGDDEEGIGSVHLKQRMLWAVAAERRERQGIVAAYDDRPDVVQMYLQNGVGGARILDKHGLREYVPGESTALGFQEEKRADMPSEREIWTELQGVPLEPEAITTAADILERAGATFRERNAVYKDNADNVGKVMAALFPDGVQIKTAADHKMYHLFELIIVKMTRFANSGLTHTDSIHDMAVYAAMCENLAATHNLQFKAQ